MSTTENVLDNLKTKQSDLKTRLLDVLSDINRVKDQISRAKSKAASTGDYSDTKWYRSANAALNHLKLEHQTILLQISEVKAQIAEETKHRNKIDGQTFERIFVRAAERVLPAAQYQQLLTMTHLEMQALDSREAA